MRNKAAALFIRCSDEDAEKIRQAAKAERRTLGGFILNAVISRIDAREKMLQRAALLQHLPTLFKPRIQEIDLTRKDAHHAHHH